MPRVRIADIGRIIVAPAVATSAGARGHPGLLADNGAPAVQTGRAGEGDATTHPAATGAAVSP